MKNRILFATLLATAAFAIPALADNPPETSAMYWHAVDEADCSYNTVVDDGAGNPSEDTSAISAANPSPNKGAERDDCVDTNGYAGIAATDECQTW